MNRTYYIGRTHKTNPEKNVSNVRNALTEKGLSRANTPIEALPITINEGLAELKPENIRGNVKIGNVVGTLATAWHELNISDSTLISTFPYPYIFYHSNGIDVYSSSANTSAPGVYHLNLKTGEKTQIYSQGISWNNFFEDSKGNVYVGSSSTGNGILCLNGNVAELVYSIGFYWQYFFEDSKGNVYASSSDSNNQGIIHLNNKVSTQIYTSGYSWQYFFEDSKGNVYVSGSRSDSGILNLNGDNAVREYSTGYHWRYFFEDSKGNVYVSSSSSGTGILHIYNNEINQIYSEGYNWLYFFEDSKNNVYVGGNGSSSKGIIYLNGNTAEQLNSVGYGWTFFEDSKGNVYAGNQESRAGFFKIDGKSLITLSTPTYDIDTFFEASNGYIYISGRAYGISAIKPDGTLISHIIGTGPKYGKFFEDSKGNVYACCTSSYQQYMGILHLNKEIDTLLHSEYGTNYNIIHETEYGVIVSQNTEYIPGSECLLIDGITVYKIKL